MFLLAKQQEVGRVWQCSACGAVAITERDLDILEIWAKLLTPKDRVLLRSLRISAEG